MTMPVDSTTLTNWLAAYDPSGLHNEADVEAKFVQPLFRLLGYPDSHQRGKYPVTIHAGRKGRKHEVDQVYFASSDPSQQKPGKALIIVEAKRIDVSNLDAATAQAQSYGEQLRPLLLVITNGLHLLILRRRRFGSDEVIINTPVQQLVAADSVRELIELVEFETVLRQHAQLIDELSHERSVILDQALRAHPDIQEILAQGDFVEAEIRNGQSLRVARVK